MNFESVVVDNSRRSRKFDNGASNGFGRENIGWSRRMSDHSSVADMAKALTVVTASPRFDFPRLTDALLARPHKVFHYHDFHRHRLRSFSEYIFPRWSYLSSD